MFACLHGRSVSECAADSEVTISTLVELAFTFSPLVEQTSADTIVLDVEGQDLLFGEMVVQPNEESNAMRNIANAIVNRPNHFHLTVIVSMLAKNDGAFPTAQSVKAVIIRL